MESDEYRKVRDAIAIFRMGNSSGIDQTHFDRIVILVDAYPEHFPKKFKDLLNSHDNKNYPVTHREQTALFRRLDTILSTYEELPEERRNNGNLADEENNDELAPKFTLNKSDLERVLELCSQMRKIVLATVQFDEPHKLRLLNRIAGIEKQAVSKKGLLDVVRAGVSDVGETLGKFGVDIKPLTDRMKEVASIARRSSKQYDQLPAPEEIERLPKPEDFDEKAGK